MAAKRFENPLIPDKRMRAMFAAMVEARILGERARASRLARGSEAVWVGAAIGLRDNPGDLVSAGPVGSPLDHILGTRLNSTAPARLDPGTPLRGSDRLLFALGAARTLTATNNVILLFTSAGELTPAQWKRVLTEALRLNLPTVFVVVPEKKSPPGAAAPATKSGLPGIAVDAADAIAMYRVAQECLLRARTGGGPALIEAVNLPGTGDPIALLRRQMLVRRVASAAWLDAVESRFRARLPA